MAMTAVRDGDDYVLNGEKTWISNGGIADVYTFLPAPAKRQAQRACRSSSCLPIRRDWKSPSGWKWWRRIRWRGSPSHDCRIPASAMIGARARLPHRHVGARRVPLDRGRGRSRLCPAGA
jgi:acyl-CoA dehydrogenase